MGVIYFWPYKKQGEAGQDVVSRQLDKIKWVSQFWKVFRHGNWLLEKVTSNKDTRWVLLSYVISI